MNLTIARGLDLRIGSGLYQLRMQCHGRGGYLIGVPFLGKAWSYAGAGSGRTSWTEVKADHTRGWED